MKRQVVNVLIGISLLFIAVTALHCGSDEPDSCPTKDDPIRVEIVEGKFEFFEAFETNDAPDHFGADIGEEAYLRVLSDSEIELIFERDGEEVIQKFEVNNRDTIIW